MARPRKNNAEYFSHDADMRNNRKVKAVRAKFGIEGYAIWCMTLELLCAAVNNRVDYNNLTKSKLIAIDFGVGINQILNVWDFCIKLKLLQLDNAYMLHCQDLDERLSILYDKRKRKLNKYSWHKNNKSVVFEHSAGVCERCNTETSIHGGVVHHKTYNYKDSVYNYNAIELLQNKVIGWFCHDCHYWIHSNFSIDGITRILNKYCKECEKKINTTDPKKEVCSKCASINKREQESLKEKVLNN